MTAGGKTQYVSNIVVHRQAYEQTADGQAVTVLHQPDHPERSTVYELGGYRWG